MSANGTHQTLNVPEADLRPGPIVDPVERFKSGNIGSLKKYLLREVVQWYRNQHLHDDLVSLGHVGVDLKPHQVGIDGQLDLLVQRNSLLDGVGRLVAAHCRLR